MHYIPYSEDYLAHHGILGMKWGVRRWQNKDGSLTDAGRKHYGYGTKKLSKYSKENLKNASVQNLNKWGADASHNVLYISGKSGTGKSTLAIDLAKDGDVILHLDGYSENKSHMHSVQNKSFNQYLDKHVKNWTDIYMDDEKTKAANPNYWKKVDEFNKAINDFAANEYKNNHRVIVEGVQIDDGWLFDTSSSSKQKSFSDQPYIKLKVDEKVARERARERDKDA